MNDNPLLDVLTREGVLLNVSVRYWRAAKKLKAEDLGLDPDDITDRLISLGHKKLLPRDALAPFALIESRAHALIDASTFPFLNGLGHFLPNRKLQEVTDKLAGLEREFESARQDFVAGLREQTAGLCEEMLASFRDGKTGCHQKTLNRLRNWIDEVKALNFAGDQDLEARLEEVRRQFLTRTAEEYRDDDKARIKLTQGIANLANAAREMARADATEIVERFGQMGRRRFNLAA